MGATNNYLSAKSFNGNANAISETRDFKIVWSDCLYKKYYVTFNSL